MDPHLFNQLETIQARLQQESTFNRRIYLTKLNMTSRGALLVGPRGVGKSTYLIDFSKDPQNSALYVSADNSMIQEAKLSEIGQMAYQKGYRTLLVDEVHFAKDWSIHLKSLFDSYPKLKIIATDSSSLVLQRGVADLSRRFVMYRLPLLSFREYLSMKFNYELQPLQDFSKEALLACFKAAQKIDDQKTNLTKEFRRYITVGTRPFFNQDHFEDRILNIIDKTIFFDVPFFLPEIQSNHLQVLKSLVGHLALSPVPTINIESMSKHWGLSKEKLYKLLYILEELQVILIVRYKSDKKATGKGAKIFLTDTAFYHVLDGNVGSQREAFASYQFKELRLKFYASDSESEYDFLVDGQKVEIGGPNKKPKGADLVFREGQDIATKNTFPLWLLSFW